MKTLSTRIALCGVLLGALALGAGTGAAVAEDGPSPLRDKVAPSPSKGILEAFRQGKWDAVVLLGGALSTKHPEHARVQYLVGEARLQTSAWKEAETAFRTVLKTRPAAVPARTGLAKALAGLGKTAAAEKEFKAATTKAPKDAGALLAWGEFLLSQKRNDDALKALGRAYKLERKNPLVVRGLVDGLIRSEDLKTAGKRAGALAKALPKHPMGHFLSGWVSDRRGKADDAISAYEKALAIDDTFLDAHKNLAIVCIAKNPMYQDKERREKGLAHFARYFELGGKDPDLKKVYETIKAVLPRFVK